ncbi:conjugal transfer transcriptional regulator TraJ [Methyloterricola oryzae]|uniref:conjugal transfer transcriptional regulator TraJ n=1 Tax=Methyloterricola oryzae TaxID=1495050 RepID=UPI0005EBD93F|nr:conjugal transfer transcriptional regulator TraJ [Methyloterricola oryzae]
METLKPSTRKNSPPIKVYCLPDERRQIETNADRVGLALSSYLLTLGLGYEPRGVVDGEKVDELMRINGDLGRLGGLLKLWLTDDARAAMLGDSTIRALLSKIEDTQDLMTDAIRSVVLPRSKR